MTLWNYNDHARHKIEIITNSFLLQINSSWLRRGFGCRWSFSPIGKSIIHMQYQSITPFVVKWASVSWSTQIVLMKSLIFLPPLLMSSPVQSPTCWFTVSTCPQHSQSMKLLQYLTIYSYKRIHLSTTPSIAPFSCVLLTPFFQLHTVFYSIILLNL